MRFSAKLWIGLLAAAGAVAQTYQVRHDHWRGQCAGRLTFDDEGVAFESEQKKDHSWRVPWLDIQQARVLDTGEFRLLTYKDRKWRFGADREYKVEVLDRPFEPDLEPRLGRRFVSGLAGAPVKPLWEIPAKHLLRFSGSEGVILVAEDRIVYRADRPGDSRTWMFSDIENISTSDAYQLTITTYERARGNYGDRKGYNFRLKQPLDPERYNELWRRLERSKGLQILSLADEEKYER